MVIRGSGEESRVREKEADRQARCLVAVQDACVRATADGACFLCWPPPLPLYHRLQHVSPPLPPPLPCLILCLVDDQRALQCGSTSDSRPRTAGGPCVVCVVTPCPGTPTPTLRPTCSNTSAASTLRSIARPVRRRVDLPWPPPSYTITVNSAGVRTYKLH